MHPPLVCALFFLGALRTWNWQLALTLQESGVGLDELIGSDIANGDTRHVGGVGWRMGEGVVLLSVVPLRGVARRILNSRCEEFKRGQKHGGG